VGDLHFRSISNQVFGGKGAVAEAEVGMTIEIHRTGF